MDLMAQLLGDDFVLGSIHTRSTYPGAAKQGLHRDWMLDRRIPFPTHINSMWMLDDFTLENGATRFVPGSHLWDEAPDGKRIYPGEVSRRARQAMSRYSTRGSITRAEPSVQRSSPRFDGVLLPLLGETSGDHTRSIDHKLLADASPTLIRLWGFQAQVPWEDPAEPNVMKKFTI